MSSRSKNPSTTGAAQQVEREIAQTTLGVIAIGGLIVASFWILRPFLGAALWAAMIVSATWPILIAVQHRLRNSRALAVVVMTAGLLLLVVIPTAFAVGAIFENADQLATFARNLATMPRPDPPAWLGQIPLVGHDAVDLWDRIAGSGPTELAEHVTPYAGSLSKWLIGQLGTMGLVVLHFLMTVALAAIFYWRGEMAADMCLLFGQRLAGEHGEASVRLAAKATRSVALGVGVTALVQAVLGAIALALAGVPLAPLLGAAMFVSCIVQIGAGLILVPAVVWLYWAGHSGTATFLLVSTIIVVSLDNVLRPILIMRGGRLPLVVILFGVIGGILAFGLVGLFVGPIVLGVAWTLLHAWIHHSRPIIDDAP
jgi:predicted PurR-regulated permease PerM